MARLLVHSFASKDTQDRCDGHHIIFSWIREDDIDEEIEGYLAQLDHVEIVENRYSTHVDAKAKSFAGLINKSASDPIALDKASRFLHDGLPKNVPIRKVYTIIETEFE